MQQTVLFAFLGLGLGAMYALISQGLIVVYRGSGILNFGHGAMGLVGAYIVYDMRQAGRPFLLALVVGVAASALVGALVYALVMRHLQRAAPLIRVVATLGILLTLQAIAVLRYGPAHIRVESELPRSHLDLFGVSVPVERLLLAAIATVLALGLWWLYRNTTFGRSTTAVAENERNAASLGLSPHRIAVLNWALGSGLAGLAAIFVAPIVGLGPGVFTDLLIAALAVSLIAGFRSFPVALVAGLLLGIAQAEVGLHWDLAGVEVAVPFLFIVVALVVRGQALPLRDFLWQRLPAIGSGRIRPSLVIGGAAVMALIMASVPTDWQDSLVVLFATAIILLSIVVVTGYAGMISLGQFALAGFGAWVAGRLAATQGFPFPLAVLAGVACSVPVGVLFALPALRTRGINLAIVTLGLATVLELMVFNNGDLTGGYRGTTIESPTLLGVDLDPILYPQRYGWVVLAAFVVVALAVANVRRGRSGRRLLAIRTNERAAAALGVDVVSGKLYAFGLSAAIAGLGGVLLTFRFSQINYAQFTTFGSIADVGYAVLGGVGYLMGPVMGATLAPGSIGVPFGNNVLSGVGEYLELIGGLSIILIALANQSGIAPELQSQLRWVGEHLPGVRTLLRRRAGKPRSALRFDHHKIERCAPRTLSVKDLVVRYGGVTAADGVNVTVAPGRVVGLIGPNGAGKTTVIDAITGFTPLAEGKVELDGNDITRLKVFARARGGVTRSFQSLELFEDSTVLENLQTASDDRDRASYFRDLLWPVSPPLSPQAVAAIKEFGLEESLHTPVEDLPYGKRRLLAIARAVATNPSILLLDEPAAGLGDAETAELATLVRRLADEWGIGILVVEHDMRFVMTICDELVVLNFGRQIASGAVEGVRRDPEVLSAYLGETDEEQKVEAEATAVEHHGPDAVPASTTATVLGERQGEAQTVRPDAVLSAHELAAGYGHQPVVHDVTLDVVPGEVVVLLGANGAGKTTTLMALAGELRPSHGEVLVRGEVTKAPLHRRAREGLALVPEERSMFRGLTTLENLRLGDADPALALELFPELEQRLDLAAGMLSGGEQQMLALGRALSRRPAVLLADELSLGLSPMATARLLQAVRDAAKRHGTAVILVEQHVRKALQYADRGYVMRRGRIEAAGTAAELHARLAEIEETYLSTAPAAKTPVGAR